MNHPHNYSIKIAFITSLIFSSSYAYELRPVLDQATPHDIQLLLNLLYWSYWRSCSTREVQTTSLRALDEQWHAWKSCMERRLNPHAQAPHRYESREHDTFRRAHETFHAVQTTYAHAVNCCTDVTRYTSLLVPQLIAAIREDIRCKVRHLLQYHLAAIARQLEQCLAQKKNNCIISSLLNQLAVGSFVHFDSTWTTQSSAVMRTFLQIQEQFNNLWEIIESARAQIYHDHFRNVYALARELQRLPEPCTNLIDDEWWGSFELQLSTSPATLKRQFDAQVARTECFLHSPAGAICEGGSVAKKMYRTYERARGSN